MDRAADAENQLFHHYVHERLRRDGLVGEELQQATAALAQPLLGLVEPAGGVPSPTGEKYLVGLAH